MNIPHTYVFYADEAGHAGINFLDTQQPFHIAGGFLVSSDNEERFAECLGQIKVQSSELKGANLTKTPGGQVRAAASIRALRNTGAVPFFWALERAYCIAGKVVDVLRDPSYFPECAWLALGDFDQREEVTQKIVSKVPAALLEVFARLYREPKNDGWASFLDEFADTLGAAGEANLEATFRAAQKVLDQIVEGENMGVEHSQLAALNVPALVHTLRLVDRYVDFRRGSYRVVHDVNVQFEQTFRQMVSQLQVAPGEPCQIRLPNGKLHWQFLRNMTAFEMKDSSGVKGLQAADLLVSSIARVTKKIPTPPEMWTTELRGLAMEVLPPILDEEPAFGGMYAQLDTKVRLVIGLMSGSEGAAPPI